MILSIFRHCLQVSDSVYHRALRFIANSKALTHHFLLYSRAEWPTLSSQTQALAHIYIWNDLGFASLVFNSTSHHAASFDWNQWWDKLCLKELVSLMNVSLFQMIWFRIYPIVIFDWNVYIFCICELMYTFYF